MFMHLEDAFIQNDLQMRIKANNKLRGRKTKSQALSEVTGVTV